MMFMKNLFIAVWWCGLFNMVPVGSSCGGGSNDQVQVEANPADGACGSVDIRNSVEGFQKLANCTVIEGRLHILLIDHAEQKDYDRFRFPLLREITGHLLLYRVYGLKTLRHIFPNLAVIRGQDLFYNYALVAYEMPDLEELGLVSLTTVMRGAVRLTKNTRLCYVDTIDWPRIAVGVKESDHHIQENKDVTECVNFCPEACHVTKVDGKEARRCWTALHCQKNLECHCGSNTSSCFNGTTRCCNKNCVGGCFGGEVDGAGGGVQGQSCIACLNVVYQGKCLPRCPPTTYMLMQRRCLTAQQCYNMTRQFQSPMKKWKLYRPDSNELPWECVVECPTGYQANDGDTECVKCNNSCPKVCAAKVVDSIDSAQQLKGCNKIEGPLEIQIMGGSNIGLELEESLGEIREVTHYVKIVRSYALLSLHFFKSLRIIGGELEANDKPDMASLIVRDNSNLQELFTEEVTRNLMLRKGKVKFHGNRKLCLHKIQDLVEHLGQSNITTELDVSPTMNGDLVPCTVTKLFLKIQRLLRNTVILSWEKVASSDEREVLTYIINYREVTSDKVNIYQGRDACSENIWKTLEAGPELNTDKNMVLITNLKPWTRYAAYVEAVMLSSASSQAISDILTFTTSPDYPTSPTNLRVVAEQPGELLVTWNPPKLPNGNVTHYYVYWQMQVLDHRAFDQRDYCKNPITPHKEKKTGKEEELNKKSDSGGENCCTCPKSKEELKEEERERQIEIEFENYLHDHVYCKRSDALPASMDNKFNVNQLAPRVKRQSSSQGPSFQNKYTAQAQDITTTSTTITTTTTTNTTTNTSADAVMGGNSTTLVGGGVTTNQTQENTYLHLTIYDTKIPLTNLGHFQEYSIEVLACQETDPTTKDKLCSNRAITVARTKSLDKADNINASTVEVKVIANNTGDVLIRWEPPKQPNGLIIKYLIRYRKADQDHEFLTICVSQRKYQELGGHRLVNIDTGNYTFKIAAVSLAGNGSYTPLMYFFVPSRQETEKPLSMTVIAVTVVSVIIVIIIVIVIVWFIAKNRFDNQEMTVISPNPQYLHIEDLYIPDEWEVPRDKIELLKELGQGSFGMVYSGKAYNLVDGYPEYKVAIKTVNDNAGFQERLNFLKEATTMKTFDCYHVVKLIGVVSKGQPAFVIMELMAQGDLKNYLRMHRPDEEDKIGDPPTVKEILQMAGEIADGMAYLSAKKFVHRDLAARNCMVSEDKVVKIGDFGMTRDIYETDYYRKGNRGLLPVRWMAPESLVDGVFTTMSDVWSYGIVLWEMATLAAQPYQGLSNEQVVKFVGSKNKMEKPPGCPIKLWSLMQKCWQFKAKDRPTFMSIIEELVPDLDPSFQHVSYFFSEESHADTKVKDTDIECRARSLPFQVAYSAPHAQSQRHDEGEDFYIDDQEEEDDDIDNIQFSGMMDSREESRIPFITTVEDLNSNPRGGSHHQPWSMSAGGQAAAAQHSPSSNSNHRGASSSLSSSWARAVGASRGGMLEEGAGAGSGSGSPTAECVMMEELPVCHRGKVDDPLRLSAGCSSSPLPPLAVGIPMSPSSEDNSKGSSKSSSGSGGSFSSPPYHLNGLLLANGHIHNSNNKPQQPSPPPASASSSSSSSQLRTKPC